MIRRAGGAFVVLIAMTMARSAVAASTGAEFLRFIPSARAVGMGETSAAVGSGVSALSGNPAGLVGSPGSVVGLGHAAELGGQRQEAAAYAVSGERTAGGVQVVLSSMSFDAVDGAGNPVPVVAQDLVASVGGARRFFSWLRAGATARAWTSSLLDRRATGVSFDAGVRAVSADRYSAGLVVSHLGGAESFGAGPAPLPRALRAGVAARHGLGGFAVAATAEWVAPLAGPPSGAPHAGVECSWQRFALRGGYAGSRDAGRWSAGGSAGTGPFTLDYALASRSAFGLAHRISVEWQWGHGNNRH